ncbi:glycoside hydrolase family 9 protein [Kribbella sp. HUAS MG21]|uniref:Glycoside hydrolase family 9 protein n=1 Tax=Kribbella sp. HUAS MG21 TaxID=3160966 RepID=A0AAU7T6Z5_9ACTN
MQLLVPHLGFNPGPGNAVVAVGVVPTTHSGPEPAGSAYLTGPGIEPLPLGPGPAEQMPGWSIRSCTRIPLPADLAPGTYVVRIGATESAPFVVEPDRLQRQTMSDVLAYFKAMRSSGEIDRKDRGARRWDDVSGTTVDARGGWLDASGDTSKFLSHLTYTSTMSPQQIPLCAWAMLAARDEITAHHPALTRLLGARLRDEALHGADFLVRFRSPDGYFYTGIFDALTKQLDERVVTAPLQNSVRTSRYQAAYRHGAGLAIAALARAATTDTDGDHSRAEYLTAALDAFTHLEQHNRDYLFDNTESIVDDYCALLGATELAAALRAAADERVAEVANSAWRRASSLVSRYVSPADGPGWFRADEGGRPFVHAVEPGLPILALLRFAEVFPTSRQAKYAQETAIRAMLDVLRRTAAVANPFGYPRNALGQFFFPHENETGYWWQGENAAIASLSAAASACARLDEVGWADRVRLSTFATDQLAWILGRNPYDVCMLQGRGRNNVEYHSDFPNLPGGIVNGITSGWTDEREIAFLPADAPGGEEWRWAEQWIPHTGWFLLAAASAD